MISLSKVYFTADTTVKALDETSVSVPAGEFLCLLGPSGCGKSTLLKLLAGLEVPSGGRIQWGGEEGIPADLGMVFQEQGLFPWMSVAENIRFLLQNNPQIEKPQVDVLVRDTLDEIGLSKFAELYPHQLSGGMRQRVSIGRAFANRPALLLMDEPFVFLDYQTRWFLQQMLLNMWAEHKMTVIFVTHDIEEAVLLADRILLMSAQPGRIKYETALEFKRPRDLYQLKNDSAFHEQVRLLTDLLRDEFGQLEPK